MDKFGIESLAAVAADVRQRKEILANGQITMSIEQIAY